ncbi:hypothetical protein CL617_03680 [archaeon]|nr:hypothetical protein [archaeon]|tara:strand:+ start:7580 stop:8452 length:873 start_codon:yes stop_codon:yes gene_type:complete
MNFAYSILKIPYQGFKRIYRKLRLLKNKNLSKVNKNLLVKKFKEIGLKSNMNLYVHSSLSSFGYIENGPNTVIEALKEVVNNGTIMMPTFTHPKEIFTLADFCWTGSIPETFRKQENTSRSIHPLHSISVQGNNTKYLTKDHENSKASFDENSPFKKFIELENSYILMLGTENNSMIHYIQNKLNFPNLFLSETKKTNFNNRTIESKQHHPELSITYIYKNKKCSDVDFLVNMYRDLKFEEREIMKTVKIGNATCRLIDTKDFIKFGTPYLEKNMEEYKQKYSELKNGTN